MIEIIYGEFGFNDGESINVKTVKDEPFEAPAEVEKRLVETGIARYVTVQQHNVDGPCYDDTTSFDVLKQIAIKLGATTDDLKGKNSKVKLKELIEELKKPEDETSDDGENDGENSNDNAPEDNNNARDNSNDETSGDGENDGEDTPDLGNDDGVVG